VKSPVLLVFLEFRICSFDVLAHFAHSLLILSSDFTGGNRDFFYDAIRISYDAFRLFYDASIGG